MAAKNKPNEIYLNRIFDAPVKDVWDAWTTPEHVVKWFGPRGHSIKTHNMDIRTGGSWSYTMYGPEGQVWENKTKFLEVVKYSRMVYDHGGHDDRPAIFRVTVDFTEVAGKTVMEMIMALPTEEAAIQTKKMIKKVGGNSTWDRLAELVSPTNPFIINRSFDIPREQMFKMWTDPALLSQWLPPTGATMKAIKADVKTGGSIFYCMTVGEMKMYGKTQYLEITPPSRLVYTQIFCDENEKISRHPMAPTWPETMLTTVTFNEEGPNTTRVTVNWEVYGNASAAEIETFHKSKDGMAQGWGGSFDKLDEFIEKHAAH